MSNSPNFHPDSPDALSAVLSRLQLTADVYTNADFCGTWAVDTSGSRHIPFHLVGRGEAWLHLDDQPVRQLSSGDLVLFPRDDHHIVASSSDVPPEERINAGTGQDEGPVTHLICGAFEFRNRAAWPLLDSLASVIVLDLRDMSASPQLRSLIDLMVGELLAEAPGYCTAVNQLACLLFIHVIRHQINNGEVNSGLLAALFDPRISRALSAIHNQANQRWTLESLAREAAMGRSAFAQRFNELTGTTAMSYLTAWRMQEATTLLQDTTMSVLEISERCGYESESAFRKAYKKTTGQAPGAVRRQTTA